MRYLASLVLIAVLAPFAYAADVTVTIPDAVVAKAREACKQLQADLGATAMSDAHCAQIFLRMGVDAYVQKIERQKARETASSTVATALDQFRSDWPLPITKAECGDGTIDNITDVYEEDCDDGNPNSDDGCSSCTVDKGYTCTGAPSVCSTTCGDGVIVGAEVCDDRNTDDGDGCSATCVVESGYTCRGEPSVCAQDKIERLTR